MADGHDAMAAKSENIDQSDFGKVNDYEQRGFDGIAGASIGSAVAQGLAYGLAFAGSLYITKSYAVAHIAGKAAAQTVTPLGLAIGGAAGATYQDWKNNTGDDDVTPVDSEVRDFDWRMYSHNVNPSGSHTFAYQITSGSEVGAKVAFTFANGGCAQINVTGTSRSETIQSCQKAGVMDGGGGDDKVFGFGGNDTLKGGSGNDLVFGGSGADQINGGSGSDRMWGGTGADVFDIREGGQDTISDFTKADKVIGFSAIERVGFVGDLLWVENGGGDHITFADDTMSYYEFTHNQYALNEIQGWLI